MRGLCQGRRHQGGKQQHTFNQVLIHCVRFIPPEINSLVSELNESVQSKQDIAKCKQRDVQGEYNLMIRRAITITYKLGRRIVIAVIGSTILLVGILMLAAPGPAIVVIPIGLAVLGLEFAWARRWLGTLRQTLSNQAARMRINKVNPRIR